MIVTGEENLSERSREIPAGVVLVTAMDPVGGPASSRPSAAWLRAAVYSPSVCSTRATTCPRGSGRSGYRAGPVHAVPRTTDPERREAAIKFIDASIADGTFKPVIDRTFDLSEYTEAHRYMESSAQFGKIVLTVQH